MKKHIQKIKSDRYPFNIGHRQDLRDPRSSKAKIFHKMVSYSKSAQLRGKAQTNSPNYTFLRNPIKFWFWVFFLLIYPLYFLEGTNFSSIRDLFLDFNVETGTCIRDLGLVFLFQSYASVCSDWLWCISLQVFHSNPRSSLLCFWLLGCIAVLSWNMIYTPYLI